MYDQSDIFFVQDTAKFPFVLSWSCWYGILFMLFFFKVNFIWLSSMTDIICACTRFTNSPVFNVILLVYILLLSAEFQKDKMISIRHKEHFPLGEDLAVLLIPWFSLFMAITL